MNIKSFATTVSDLLNDPITSIRNGKAKTFIKMISGFLDESVDSIETYIDKLDKQLSKTSAIYGDDDDSIKEMKDQLFKSEDIDKTIDNLIGFKTSSINGIKSKMIETMDIYRRVMKPNIELLNDEIDNINLQFKLNPLILSRHDSEFERAKKSFITTMRYFIPVVYDHMETNKFIDLSKPIIDTNAAFNKRSGGTKKKLTGTLKKKSTDKKLVGGIKKKTGVMLDTPKNKLTGAKKKKIRSTPKKKTTSEKKKLGTGVKIIKTNTNGITHKRYSVPLM